MLRGWVAALMMALAGCGGGNEGGPDPEPEPQTYTVSVQVVDSLAARPVPGITVTAGTASDVADADGIVDLTLAAGDYPLTVNDPRFEPRTATLTVASNGGAGTLRLRRVAPYLKAFSYDVGTGVGVAQVVDLQGRETIDRNDSAVFYGSQQTQQGLYLGPALWQGIDAETYNVTFQPFGAPTIFNLYLLDSGGAQGSFRCVPPAPCEEL